MGSALDTPGPFGAARSEDLAGDASTRRYRRLWFADGSTAVLVEYPGAARHRLSPDIEVLEWSRSEGLPVPVVLDRDLQQGRALLEDLGSTDAEDVMTTLSVDRRPGLVARLLAPLEVLAAISPARLPEWNTPLDRDRLRWELAGFELWFVRHHRGRKPFTALSEWLDELVEELARHPTRVCHRDYHMNNLLMDSEGRMRLIDIQDILVGPDTYDAVSLLFERSAASLLSADQRDAALSAWAEATRAAPGWRERARLVRLQRGLKVLGTFARFVVAGRTEYLRWMQEVAEQLVDPLAEAEAPAATRAILLD